METLLIIICILWVVAALWQCYSWYLPLAKAPNTTHRGTAQPDVSVVVCVHDRADNLSRLLTCLQQQSYPHYEIVIVNDGPHPEIATFLERYPHRDRLRIVDFDASQKTVPGKKAPLAAGIKAAAHDWLLLTDSDCVPRRDWIATMVKHIITTPGVVLGIGPFLITSGLRNLLQRFDGLVVAIQYTLAAYAGSPYMGVGRNLMYHRTLFDQAGGFDRHAHLASGDDDLFIQSVATGANTSVCTEPAGFVYSSAPETWTGWLHQKRRHVSASRLYTIKAKLRTAIFSVSFCLSWLLLPVVMLQGLWMLPGLAFLVIQWIVFARVAVRFAHPTLIPWFPLLTIWYCIILCFFPILLILRPPQTWNIS